MDNKVAEVIRDQAYQKNGSKVVFTSSIDFEEATFIGNLIRELRPQNTIEIGCAEGASSLTIMDALTASGGQHTIVDPFQTTYWESKGINLLQMFGYDQYRLIEKGSEIALPALLDKGEKFDFAFIDGYHTFDHTLLDAFYLIKMLKVGGVLVIDDVQMPAINKCLRYLHNYPCLQFKASSAGTAITRSRKLFDSIKGGMQLISGIMPQKWRSELLDDSVLRSDRKLGLRSSMVAFKKTAEDTREWNWWKSF